MKAFVKNFASQVSSHDELGVASSVRLSQASSLLPWLTSGSTSALVSSVESQCLSSGLSPQFSSLLSNSIGARRCFLEARQNTGASLQDTLETCFKHQQDCFDKFLELYRTEGSWMVELMRVLIDDTRRVASIVDKVRGDGSHTCLRDTKRLLESCFRYTTMGRATTEDAVRKRRVALYIVNSQFRVFFSMKSLQLCRNLIRQVDMPTFPPMDTFPLSQRVTYNFFLGRLFIFEDRLDEAREALQFALRNCHPSRPENVRRIYEYLVPINLLVGRRPGAGLLERFGLEYFAPFIECVRIGNVRALEDLVELHRDKFIERGLFLAMEKLKVVAYRNLMRNVVHLFKLGNVEKKDRVPLETFVLPYHKFGERDPMHFLMDSKEEQDKMDSKPTEESLEHIKCILANLIFLQYLKAYISHEKKILVLSPKDPFPAIGNISI